MTPRGAAAAPDHDSLAAGAAFRLATRARIALAPAVFWTVVTVAAAIVWLAPRPPMTDLAQHAGQVTHLKALLLGQSPWAAEFRINPFTPYLLGYGLALALSFAMPVLAAVKLILTAAFLAFVAACRQLRREVGGDPRLDLLFVPSFFGFAWDFGFYSFLVAAPLAVVMVRLGWRYANRPGRRDALALVGAGVLLLLSHGLMFLFAGLVAGLLLIAHARSAAAFAAAVTPYAILLALCAAFTALTRRDAGAAALTTPEWWSGPIERLVGVFVFSLSGSDLALVPLAVAMVAAALLMAQPGPWRRAIPLAAALAAVIALPDSAYAADYIASRFAVLVLPFAAIALVPRGTAAATPALHTHAGTLLLAASTAAFVAIKADRALAFAVENADFEAVLAAAEPGRRASSTRLMLDPSSAAARHHAAVLHAVAWYEVDKGGLADFSFAHFPPQLVRFREHAEVTRNFGGGTAFDWSHPDAASHDYFFARRAPAGTWPASFIDEPRCTLRLVRQSGPWALFERTACPR